MVHPGNNFWCHVSRCATRVTGIVRLNMPRYSKVSNPHITTIVNHQVFRFEISMDDSSPMQVFQAEDHTCKEKFSLFFWESLVDGKVISHISSITVIKNQEQILTVLESTMHINEKLAFEIGQEFALIHDTVNWSLRDDFYFLHFFESKGSGCLFLLHLPNFPEASLADCKK